MPLHLIKLWVGHTSADQLQAYQQDFLEAQTLKGEPLELTHVTRNFPKRAQEILQGGSIYWVIGGTIVGRQKILELRPMMKDERTFCAIVYDHAFIPVVTRPHRPFQGWLYFEHDRVPPDAKNGHLDEETPGDFYHVMGELNLL